MKEKKIPQRTCIGCMDKTDQANLLRIVNSENGAKADFTGKAAGRGCYICPKEECLEKAIKRKAFQRQFKRNVTESELESIKVAISEVKKDEA